MRRIALVLIAVLASGALAACGNDASNNQAESSPGTRQHNAADVTFAQQMILHHRQAIEMADVAAKRASTPQVKALATRVKAAQDPEITTMTEWLRSWGEDLPVASQHEGVSGTAA